MDTSLPRNSCFAVASAANAAGRARFATSLLFFVDGSIFGSWAALVPWTERRLGLSTAQLSTVLAALIAGALLSTPVVGRLLATRDSRRVAVPAALGFSLALPVLTLAPSFEALLAIAALFGACKAALDVSVNAQGVVVENAARKPILSSFQAYWSLGGLVASFAVSLALRHELSPTSLLLGLSAAFVTLVLATSNRLLAEPARRADTLKPSFAIRDPRLVRLGLLAFLGLFAEGVLLDWSAVFASTVTRVPVSVAPIAFAAFAVCMAAGRFLGDVFIARLGSSAVLRLSGGLMVTGTLVATLIASFPAALTGFALVGLGIANLVPVIFGAAGRVHEGGAGPGLATVTTIGAFGFLSGPPVIGAIAAWSGLRLAFGCVALFGLLIATAGVSALRAPRSV